MDSMSRHVIYIDISSLQLYMSWDTKVSYRYSNLHSPKLG